MAEKYTEYYTKLIAERSLSTALDALKRWQKDYKNRSVWDSDVLKKNQEHFGKLYDGNDCIWIAEELENSEGDFEYNCLVYWQNKYGQLQPLGKGVNSAITEISKAIAIVKMLHWLSEKEPQPQPIAAVQTLPLKGIREDDHPTTPPVQEGGLALKSQFIDPDKYNEVINRLIKSGNIRKDKAENLIFIPISRKNALYEAVTLFEALKSSEFLIKRDRTYDEIGNILSNTFKDWSLSLRVIGDKKTLGRISDYEAIIN